MKNIGIDVQQPKKECNDKKCPFHGSLKLRGRIFVGIVTATDAHKSATVMWERKNLIQKYERYEKRRTKIRVHNPPCINANKGDFVKIAECRPLSKTKKFAIIEKIGEDILFRQKEEALEEAKVKEKEKLEKEKKGEDKDESP